MKRESTSGYGSCRKASSVSKLPNQKLSMKFAEKQLDAESQPTRKNSFTKVSALGKLRSLKNWVSKEVITKIRATNKSNIEPISSSLKKSAQSPKHAKRKLLKHVYKPDYDIVPALYPKGCLTCGGRNLQVMYHGDRHVCLRCQKSLQTNEPKGKFVDVFLSMTGQIVVLQKQSQMDEVSKILFMKEEAKLLEEA